MKGRASFADFLIIATGTSSRHVMALADSLAKSLKSEGYSAKVEGKNSDGNWVVVDAIDCIIHIFTQDAREYYALEYMWDKN